MTIPKAQPLKQLMTQLPGVPLTMRDLRAARVSPQLAYSYVKNGWLARIGRGVFVRPGAPLDLRASLRALQDSGYRFHIGGRTALAWYGIRHHLRRKERVTLYGVTDVRLPAWLTSNFDVEYHRNRLFKERGRQQRAVSRFEDRPDEPFVSEPERAVLEMLSEVPQRQSLEEASALMQSLSTLRPAVLQQLLVTCSSVKTVRLLLTLSRELQHPFLSQLNEKKLPMGGKSRWVLRSKDTTLVLKR